MGPQMLTIWQMSMTFETIARICCSRSINAWGMTLSDLVGVDRRSDGAKRLDIMDSLAKRTENAYQKLYGWVRKQAMELASSSFDVDPVFVKALVLLKKRPAYYE